MIETIEAALQNHNYAEAERLVQTLDSQDPWAEVYQAQIQEGQHHWDQAEALFRNLLRQDHGPKVTLAARQGIERLQQQRLQSRKAAIAQAIAAPHQAETGVLILDAIAPEAKPEAAQRMAQIMNIDPYTARVILPSSGLRLYRSGAIGELAFYGQQLKDQGIPAFWITLSALEHVTVYSVSHFDAIENPARLTVESDHPGQNPQSFQFSWSDVTQRVEGQIPIFEEVLDRDARGKLKRKEQTQDHAKFCDLHLPTQNCIVRLSDAAYQFNQGISLKSQNELPNLSAWANWRQLTQKVEQQLTHKTTWNHFNTFAETALEHPELLSKLTSHINLFRREDSNWDPAFQLYSATLFLKKA